MRTRLCALSLAAGVLGAVLLLGAGTAGAHATLLSTAPADDEVIDQLPDAVELTFDEPVEAAESGIQVVAPDGDRADLGQVESDDDGVRIPVAGDQRGTYTVAWRVLSEDGHNITGSFIFHVGERTGAAELDDGGSGWLADAAGGVGRFLGFAASLTIVGAVVVTGLTRDDYGVEQRTRLLVIAAGAVGVVGVVLVLVSQAAETSGRTFFDALDVTWRITRDTRTGRLTAWRGVALATALAAATVRPLWRLVPWVALAAGGASLLLQSLAGHAWTASNRTLAVTSDVVHLAAVGVWVGGLLALAVALPVSVDKGQLARSFSGEALVAAVFVAVTGTVSGLVEVDSVSDLVDTGYGRLLLVKVAGFVVLVGLGWLNRARLVSAAERALAPLLRLVRAEVGIAAALLAVTALLVNQPPARDAAEATTATDFETVVPADDADASLQVQVVPAQVGSNDIHLFFYEGDGTTPLTVAAAQITATTADVPPRRLDELQPITTNHYSAFGVTFGSAGTWTLEVTAVSQTIPIFFTVEVSVA